VRAWGSRERTRAHSTPAPLTRSPPSARSLLDAELGGGVVGADLRNGRMALLALSACGRERETESEGLDVTGP